MWHSNAPYYPVSLIYFNIHALHPPNTQQRNPQNKVNHSGHVPKPKLSHPEMCFESMG